MQQELAAGAAFSAAAVASLAEATIDKYAMVADSVSESRVHSFCAVTKVLPRLNDFLFDCIFY